MGSLLFWLNKNKRFAMRMMSKLSTEKYIFVNKGVKHKKETQLHPFDNSGSEKSGQEGQVGRVSRQGY